MTDNIFINSILDKAASVYVWLPSLFTAVMVLFRDRPLREAFSIVLGCVATFVATMLMSFFWMDTFADTFVCAFFALAVYFSLVFRHYPTTLAILLFMAFVLTKGMLGDSLLTWGTLGGAVLSSALAIVVKLLERWLRQTYIISLQKYYSSAYTSSGFSREDMYILLTVMAFTLLFLLF